MTALPLMVDVNEYWSVDEAVDAIAELEPLGVEYVEQPLPAGDPDGLELKRRAALPVYVDEDCHTLADVAACAERAHGINIKLAKSGGIREAVRMAVAARALGLGVMLGCMVESGLAISAGAQLASLCDHVDLDGNLLLAEDPWPGVAVRGRGSATARRARASECMKRYLILAEGHVFDPHYGKTMRGVLHYGRDEVVALLDSEHAGAEHEGLPIVGTVAEALRYEPDTALVGVATSGGRLPEGLAAHPPGRRGGRPRRRVGHAHLPLGRSRAVALARASTGSSSETYVARPTACPCPPARTSSTKRRRSSRSDPTARSGR